MFLTQLKHLDIRQSFDGGCNFSDKFDYHHLGCIQSEGILPILSITTTWQKNGKVMLRISYFTINALKVCHDVTVLSYFTQLIMAISLYLPFLVYSVFGYLPYTLLVIFNEIRNISLLTTLGIFSASSFLQVAIIKNLSILENFNDKKIVIYSFCFAFSSSLCELQRFYEVSSINRKSSFLVLLIIINYL